MSTAGKWQKEGLALAGQNSGVTGEEGPLRLGDTALRMITAPGVKGLAEEMDASS